MTRLAALLAWLRETMQAKAANVSLRRQLEVAQAESEQYDEGLAESRAFGEMQAQKYQHAMESLAACVTEKQALKQAADSLRVALDTAQGQIEALRASQAGLQASEAALKARITALRAREAGRQENELLLNERVAAQAQQIADLNETYAAYVLPPLPETTTVAKPTIWLADILLPLFRPVSNPTAIWLDGTYYLVPAETYQPILDHWRKYLMLPFEYETNDCDDRGIDFRAWAHRWSKGLFTPGVTIGLAPWALVDGKPYPHAFCVVVDPDGRVWALDPAFLPSPVPWSDETTMQALIY